MVEFVAFMTVRSLQPRSRRPPRTDGGVVIVIVLVEIGHRWDQASPRCGAIDADDNAPAVHRAEGRVLEADNAAVCDVALIGEDFHAAVGRVDLPELTRLGGVGIRGYWSAFFSW